MVLARCIDGLFSALSWLTPIDRRRVPEGLGALREFGDYGEDVAVRFLRRQGFKILARNYVAGGGRSKVELDVVAVERIAGQRVLCFVEVKTRRRDDAVRPEEAVGQQKQRNIARGAELYMRAINYPRVPIRFDIVEVVLDIGKRPDLRLIRDAFAGDSESFL